MQAIDYDKYANMNRSELLRSLTNAEKKQTKIIANYKKETEALANLIAFLKSKVKESLDNPKYDFIPMEEASCMKNAEAILKTFTKEQLEQLDADTAAATSKADDDD